MEAISLGSRVRLVSRHAARLAVEGDLAVLYYYTCNPRVLNAQVRVRVSLTLTLTLTLTS